MQELTVTSLVRYLKNKLDSDNNLQRIKVTGEISNYHRHFSGHLYFTLKDENSSISCVMFKSSAASLSFEPKTGDKVTLIANTSLFEASGQLQLYVQRMDIAGKGDLYAQYEALKAKLTEKGIFDNNHKKSLKKAYIDSVCVLVGDKSAAMSDIKTMFSRRWPLAKVDYYPVLVQGENAPTSIIEKLLEVDKKKYDAIILARGGGSFEDLFCFNNEQLVNTIYNLNTFIVTGVGHEQDFTLVDFVSDLRAPTPTAAVELITPNILDVNDELDSIINSLNSTIIDKLDRARLTYDYLLERLSKYQKNLLNINIKIDGLISNAKINLLNKINNYNTSIAHNLSKIKVDINNKLNVNKLRYKRLETLLKAYSSENVLNRGYTLILQNNKVITSKKKLLDNEFTIRFKDGEVTAERK